MLRRDDRPARARFGGARARSDVSASCGVRGGEGRRGLVDDYGRAVGSTASWVTSSATLSAHVPACRWACFPRLVRGCSGGNDRQTFPPGTRAAPLLGPRIAHAVRGPRPAWLLGPNRPGSTKDPAVLIDKGPAYKRRRLRERVTAGVKPDKPDFT